MVVSLYSSGGRGERTRYSVMIDGALPRRLLDQLQELTLNDTPYQLAFIPERQEYELVVKSN